MRRRRTAPAKTPIGRQVKRAAASAPSLGNHEKERAEVASAEPPPPLVASLAFGNRAARAQPKTGWIPSRPTYPTEEAAAADEPSDDEPRAESATAVIVTLAEKNRVLTRRVKDLERRLDSAKACQLCLDSRHQATECPQRALGNGPPPSPRATKATPPWAMGRPAAKCRPRSSNDGDALVPRPPPGPPPVGLSPSGRRRGQDDWCPAAIMDVRSHDTPPPRRARRPLKRPAQASGFPHRNTRRHKA